MFLVWLGARPYFAKIMAELSSWIGFIIRLIIGDAMTQFSSACVVLCPPYKTVTDADDLCVSYLTPEIRLANGLNSLF